MDRKGIEGKEVKVINKPNPEIEQAILDLYNDPEQGFTNPIDIRRKLKDKGINVTLSVVEKVLSKSVSYTLNKDHKQAKKHTKTKVSYVCQQLQADVVFLNSSEIEIKENKGYNGILTIIDVLSKYAWAYPLKTKTAKEITLNFSKCLDDIKAHKRKVERLQTDEGKEFYNKEMKALLKKWDITLFSTESKYKAAVVERFNKTLKLRIIKYQDFAGKWEWYATLPKLIVNYNNTRHGTIKMTPSQAFNDIHDKLFQTLMMNYYGEDYRPDPTVPAKLQPAKFKPGDFVRLATAARVFKKQTRENSYTHQIFRVDKLLSSNPNTYRVIDLTNEDVSGQFNESDLTLFDKPADFEYRIDKVLERKGNKVLVSFLGYPPKFNLWMPKSAVSNLTK